VSLPGGTLLANDTDPNPGDTLSVISVGTSSVGASVTLVNGQVAYDIGTSFQELGAGEVLADQFAYTISDQKGATATGVVEVSITGVNDAPVVTADFAQLIEDQVITASGNVLANDSDIDAGTVLEVAAPGAYAGAYGSLILATDGSYSYTLDAGSDVQSLGRTEQVVDQFTYTATDGITGTDSTLQFAVSGTNDAPIVVKPLADQDLSFNKAFTWQMPADSFIDIDQGDALEYTATIADGSCLPDWLVFDSATRTFSGKTPKEVGFIDIRVTATDRVAATGSTEGSLSASDVFRLSVSHGNEGVGNGQDAAPAGHDINANDGPDTHPGLPGAKQQQLTAANSGEPGLSSTTTKSGSVQKSNQTSSYLEKNNVEQFSQKFDETNGNSGNESDIFARWQAMNRALADDGAKYDNGAWQRDSHGTDIAELGKAADFLGSTHALGTDNFSLAETGTNLKGFNGLKEGVKSLAA